MDNPLKRLLNQSILYGLSTIVPRFLNFLLVPIYTYYFPPEKYGIVADLYSWTILLNIIVTYGMETALMRFYTKYNNDLSVYSTAFYFIFFSSILFLAFVIYLKYIIANLLGYYQNSEYIVYFALIIFFDAISSIPFVKLRLENEALKFASIKILNVVINVSLNILLIVIIPKLNLKNIYINFKLDVSLIFISNLVSSLITFLLLIKKFPPLKLFNFKLLKKLLLYGIPLMLGGLAGSINDIIDRQFIKYLSPLNRNPLEDLGIYFANIKIAVILLLFIQTYRYASEPFFFSNVKEKNSVNDIAKAMTYFISISLFIFLFTFGNLAILKYYIGKDYWSGLKIIPVVLFANVLVGIFINLSIWYKLADKTYYGIFIISIGLILTIILNYILIPIYGYVAAAYVRLLSYFVMIIISFYFSQSIYQIKYEIRKIAKYFLIAIVILFLMSVINKYLLNSLIILLINNLLVLIFLIYFLKSEKINLYKYLVEISNKLKGIKWK